MTSVFILFLGTETTEKDLRKKTTSNKLVVKRGSVTSARPPTQGR